jgi:hypothetical protein
VRQAHLGRNKKSPRRYNDGGSTRRRLRSRPVPVSRVAPQGLTPPPGLFPNERNTMATRKQYWVQYLESRWKVRHNGTTLSSHAVKDDAVNAGVTVAKANAPSELVICRADGTIEDKRTYGDDPYPPKG